jgi:hypothetical protein
LPLATPNGLSIGIFRDSGHSQVNKGFPSAV